MKYLLLIVAAVVALGGAWLYWRKRTRSEQPLISIVALLREPISLDPAVLARTAGKVWNVDLGNGQSEGADGFVVGVGEMNTIKVGDRVYLVHCMPAPYCDDPESESESITDVRLRSSFAEHRAWFSFDALELGESPTAAAIAEHYKQLAKVFAEFLDENCQLIYLPQTEQLFAVNDETHKALLSDDPIAALVASRSVPITPVAGDDPRMQKAVAEAQENWPAFVAAFEAKVGTSFCIKAPISYDDVTEFIWINVTAIEGDHVYGTLDNEPADLGPLKQGSKVRVPLTDLNDWVYIDNDETLQGGFTLAAVRAASQ